MSIFQPSGRGWLAVLVALSALSRVGFGEDSASPPRLSLTVTGPVVKASLPVYPATERLTMLTTTNLETGFTSAAAGTIAGYTWWDAATNPAAFYRLQVIPLAEAALWSSILLNRLTYGPSPDDLERVVTGSAPIGPEAFIEEQLQPERIAEDLDIDRLPGTDGWQFASATGTASSSTLYLYLTAPGELYLDDLVLVRGSVAGAGTNLIKNGDFESTLNGSWTVSTNHAPTSLSTEFHHGGQSSLRLVATSGGSTKESSVWQTMAPALTSGQTYTLSYWYLPNPNSGNLTLRLSGSGITSTPGTLLGKLHDQTATLTDLRAWYVLHAVQSKRQLFEVMTQFIDNHFTTQYSKSRDWVDGKLTNSTGIAQIAANFEFREVSRWREVLRDPNGTFFDLLKISAESPAMIIYLDTVTSSKGSPNENYSRELLELFTFGVDNGYDQQDIEQMARAWTGWRVDKLPPGQADNPLATPVTNPNTDPGVWTFRFRADKHDTNAITIFTNKVVEARFGPPYAGRSYQLNLPARSAADGLQDGYDVLRHLADQPYTEEYLSVKLCQWFVHENFAHGVYDYTDPNLSPEARLIRDCLTAWETPAADGRKGNLRQVLGAIFHSELFRRHAAAQQKVKTPLEFAVSALRAVRAANGAGGFTASTDGYDLLTPMDRFGMKLFERVEPDGWSEFGRDWINTSALVERMRFVQNLMIAPNDTLKTVDYGSAGRNNVADPVALIKLKLAPDRWPDAGAVADYFLGVLFPGEGRANLDYDRTAAINFLNSNNAGVPESSPFHLLDPAGTAYSGRVRGLVALLMCLPRFQEQ